MYFQNINWHTEIEKNIAYKSGDGSREGQIKGMSLRDTKYYEKIDKEQG